MKKENIFVGLLAVLLVMTLIQTIQLKAMAQEIKDQEGKITTFELNTQKLAENDLSIGSTSFSGSTGGSLAVQKLKELPQMVGGC